MDINYDKWKSLEWEKTAGNSRAGNYKHSDEENTAMCTRPSSVQIHILQTNTHAGPGDEYIKSGGLFKNLVWFRYTYERTFHSVQSKQLMS